MSVIIDAICANSPEKPALAEGSREIRYGALAALIDERSARLAAVSVLGLALDNSIDWVLWDLAALQAGVPCVPLPPFFSAEQSGHAIEAAGISHIISPDGLGETGLSGGARLPEGTAKVTFTSGTTGRPKGVCLPEAAMADVAGGIVGLLGADFTGIHASILPLAVLLENVAGVYAGLMAGCTVRLTGLAEIGADYRGVRRVLAETGATSAILVPEVLRLLMAQVAQEGPLPDLAFIAVGGSKLDPALIDQARQMGLPVYEGYGLSECASVVSLNRPGADRPGTVGKPLPHVKIEIRDGAVHFTDPGFLGYVGEAVSKPFDSGDLGRIDEAGYLSITGRRKNVLITSFGRNISPEWVEAALLMQPAIAQAVVYGDAQTHLSALVVPFAPDADIAAAVAAANAGLPDYARIAAFEAVEPFTPANGMLTGTGRPRREMILSHYGKKDAMSFYERLVESTAQARGTLLQVPQLVDGLQGRISRETYIAYLTEAFHHVSHTVPFLLTMGAELPLSKRWLHRAVIDYLVEEVGHEEWILNDIEAAGGDRAAARASKPNLETQALISYNYDYLRRRNPVGFLGMVFMLESTSVQMATKGASALQEALGLPKEAFSYLQSHGELDISHMKFFEKTVNQVSDPDDQAAIIEVAGDTFRLFANLLRAIPHDGQVRHVA